MPNKSRNFAIIGLGSFGRSLAMELTRLGDNVLAIDADENRAAALSGLVNSTVQLDSSDPQALQECGLDAYDVVVISIGENSELSILTAMNVLELGCTKVWVKAQTSTQRKVLEAIGVHRVVLPEQAFGELVAQSLHNPFVDDYLAISDETYIVKVTVGSEAIARVLADKSKLEDFAVSCLGVLENDALLPATEDQIGIGVSALLLGSRRNLRKLAGLV